MDFFQRVGNFFTGAGWVTDEEERRKKRQQQQPRPKVQQPRPQKQQVINDLFKKPEKQQQPSPGNFFNLKNKPEPIVKPAQTVKPKTYTYDDNEFASLKKAFQQGRFAKEDYVKYTRERANRANKAMTNGRVTAGDVGKTLIAPITEPLRVAKEQNRASNELRKRGVIPDAIGTKIGVAKNDRRVQEAKRAAGGVEYDPTKGIVAAIDTFANAADVAGLRSLLIRGGRKVVDATGNVVSDTVDAAKGTVAEKVREVVEDIEQRRIAAADAQVANQTRRERINQREADDAMKRAEERAETITDNTPARQKGYGGKVLPEQPVTLKPHPSGVSELHRVDAIDGQPNLEGLDRWGANRGTGGWGTGVYFNISEQPARAGTEFVRRRVANTMDNPFVLDTLESSDAMNKFGQFLMASVSKPEFLEELPAYARQAGIKYDPDLIATVIKKKQDELNGRYAGISDKTLEDVDQPINDYMRSLGYDGVINKGMDNASAGSVVFRNTPAFERAMKQLSPDNLRTTTRNATLPDAETLSEISPLVIQKRTTEEMQKVTNDPNLTPEQKRQRIEEIKQLYTDTMAKLEANRKATEEMVEEARAGANKVQDAREETIEQVQAAQAAKVAPENPGGSAAPTPAATEERINNAYETYANRSYDEAGIDREKGLTGRNLIYKLFTPYQKAQQAYVKAVDDIREGAADKLQEGVQSKNQVAAALSNAPKAFFKNFGLSDANREILLKRTSQLQNSGNVAKTVLRDMEDSVKRAGEPNVVYERIYRVLETPEYLAKRYGDDTKLTVEDLSPAELEAFEKLVRYNKIRNDLNFDTGLINAEQHAQFANGLHSPRVYDFEALGNPAYETSRYLDLRAGKQRKDINDVDEAIIKQSLDSPFQASALRLESALKNKANAEALQNLNAAGLLLDKKPNKNFMQLVGKKYGDMEGKWIDSQILSQFDNKEYYTSKLGQTIGDTVEAYQQTPLGALDRFFKSTKTVLSPGTFGGNIGSNVIAFAGAANVNPITAAARMAQGAKQLTEHSRGFNANVNRAEQAGLFAGDTGRAITGSRDTSSALKDNGLNPYKAAQDVYGATDKAFALGLFNELLARGLSPEEAVRRAHKATQNYGNAGRIINTSADSPILGKPFARFIPELVRIMKNRAVYNPVGTLAGASGVAYGANELSKAAGETNEERAAREGQVGQTQLPGTGWINDMMTNGEYDGNLSLNVAVPDRIGDIDLPGSGTGVNIARTTGLNYPIEPGGSAETALIRQLSPFADPTRTNAQGEEVFSPAQLISSMTFRPIADQVVNRDFMGREITDRDNKTYYEGQGHKVQKFSDELSQEDQVRNRLEAAAMNYLPFANETNALYSAATGQKDYFGKERTVPEAIMRVFGLKAESNTEEDQAERVDTKRYFDEDLTAVQSFLQTNPDLAESYFKISNPSRNRITNVKTSDMITPERWDVINSDTSGRLFNFLKEQAIARAEREGELVDPIYTEDPEHAKYIAELRSRPSGDDIEAQEILRATTDWFPAYEKRYFDYLDKTDFTPEVFPGAADPNPRVKAYREASKPIEQPPIVKQYYQIKNQDPAAAKEFYKTNKTALGAAFDVYAGQRLQRINTLRELEGYDPISPETFSNKTFGFDADGGGGGWGYGGGGGGSRTPTVNNLGEMTSFASDVTRLKEFEPQQTPQLQQLIQTLMAGQGGGRQKPRLGASSRGQG